MDETRSYKLKRYVDLTLVTRDLSSPQVRFNQSAEDYRNTLLNNFRNIGVIAQENNDILSENWFPLLEKPDALTEDEAADLQMFGDLLLNTIQMENIDMPLFYRQSLRLLRDAENAGDDAAAIDAHDRMIDAAFIMMHITQRLVSVSDLSYRYRDEGLASANRIINFLTPSRFRALTDEAQRHKVLVTARYICTLFERADTCGDREVNDLDLAMMDRALALANDPFYRDLAPSYNWENHVFRTLQYITSLIERGNPHGFNREQLRRVHDAATRLEALWKEKYETLQSLSTDVMVELSVRRSAYYAGRMSLAAYKDALVSLFERCDEDDYSFRSAKMWLLIPVEYMLVLDPADLSAKDRKRLMIVYRHLIGYVHRMPKKGTLSFLLTFVTEIIDSFIDVPDGMDFETFCLNLIASLHPPTYVHSMTVADIARCLTAHLLRREPARFFGLFNLRTEKEVLAHAEEICDFAYHASLCHDFGKLHVAEIIMTYGRSLLKEEFDLVELHPAAGAHILSRHASTQKYANVALLHHKWYNDRGGYPFSEKKNRLPESVIIDIVTCADCMDASTDSVGRSYKFGKSLETFLTELKDGAGTRYAPYLALLTDDADVRANLRRILSESRNENYKKAYHILTEYDARPPENGNR